MNDKFDQLAKAMAQSVTRRGALKKFGVGLAGVALASLGLPNKAEGANQCVEWVCSKSTSGFVAYTCGGHPKGVAHGYQCYKVGAVGCSYCTNCC